MKYIISFNCLDLLNYLFQNSPNADELIKIQDYLSRFQSAVETGDASTLLAALRADGMDDNGSGILIHSERMGYFQKKLNPNTQFVYFPSSTEILTHFYTETALGTVSALTGGVAFTALRSAKTGLVLAGGASGGIGDGIYQGLGLGLGALTKGSYGRTEFSINELGLSTGIGIVGGGVSVVAGSKYNVNVQSP